MRAILARTILSAIVLAATAAPATAEGVSFHVVKESQDLVKGDIVEAKPVRNGDGRWAVSIRLNKAAARRLAALTANNIGRRVQLVVGQRIVMSAVVREAISGGAILVSGNYSEAEAKRMAALIRQGQ